MVDSIIQPVSPLLGTGAAGAAAEATAAGAATTAAAGADAGADAAASAGLTSEAAVAAGVASGVGACACTSAALLSKLSPSTREANSFFMSVFSCVWRLGFEALQRFLAGFASANAHNLFEVVDKNLAVADLAGTGSAFDGLDDTFHQVV